MLEIDFDELDTAEDGSSDMLHHGQPFSGMAYERDEKTGHLIGLAGYTWGAPHGPFRSWYHDGRLKSEVFFFKGLRNGPAKEWYEDGRPKSDAYWECDFCVFRIAWSSRGERTEEFRMMPTHRDWHLLEQRRRRKGWRVIDIDIDLMEFVERPHGWQMPDPANNAPTA
ncbi:toxin-antitoxin system YwqK family antitoxin [Nannocystaceae bacterium ST9]